LLFAVAVVLVAALALLFVIPQHSGGICCCFLLLQLFLSLPLPFCLSFRSAAEESAVAF
jgi:hypothetical protein